MKCKCLILLIAAAFPGLSYAQSAMSFQCSLGDLQRRLQILTEPGVSVPCEVHYFKDSEEPGERQILWSATNQAGYCERRTEEFVAKLRGMGWNCQLSEPAAPVAKSEPQEEPTPTVDAEGADDSAALMPADDAETGTEQ